MTMKSITLVYVSIVRQGHVRKLQPNPEKRPLKEESGFFLEP